MNLNLVLTGIVGSTAYGLSTENSDIDRLGIFASRTEKILGLHPPKETLTTIKPDVTLHEVGKFVKLALSVNPTVTELLWLNDYEFRNEFGDRLIAIRESFLSRIKVKNSYLGYATQQFLRLESREDGSFSSDTKKRTAKHARHLARLLHQGIKLSSEGHLQVKLENPDFYFKFGEEVSEGNIELAKDLLSYSEEKFNNSKSVLPETPNESKVEAWLLDVRRYYFE